MIETVPLLPFLETPETWWDQLKVWVNTELKLLTKWQKIFGLSYLLSLGLSGFGWWWLSLSLAELTSVQAQAVNVSQDLPIFTSSSTPALASLPAMSSATLAGLMTIHIAGAVKKPGVYNLTVGSLLVDAVKLAGGLSSSVWQDYLDQAINLAEPLTPNQKVWIPSLSQQDLVNSPNLVAESTTADSREVSQNPDLSFNNSIIPVNTASLAELMTLAGIGEKRAGDIIANRPYGNPEELITKAKISAAIVEKIKTQLQF